MVSGRDAYRGVDAKATGWTVRTKDLGQTFVDWIVSPAGQKAIAEYKIGGEQLFFPNADQLGA